MAEDERQRRMAEKFKKTPEDIAKEIAVQEEAKKKMTHNTEQLEANLKAFHQLTDPILDQEGKVLCWVRRPTAKEWEEIAPSELMQYTDPTTIPPEIAEKYKDHQFKMMAKLIAEPSHTAEEWKEMTDLVFQNMFQTHLLDVYRKLGILVGNF